MTSTRRWLIRLMVLGWLAGAAQLSAAAQTPVDLSCRDAVLDALRDISGTWEGTFRLDSASRLPERASARAIPARLHFNPVGDATTSASRTVHPGTFEIDFSQFGFELSTHEALGWSVSADSMRATLNPTVDHGTVEVHGAFHGESIAGTWRYASEPGGASGTFEVRRTGRD